MWLFDLELRLQLLVPVILGGAFGGPERRARGCRGWDYGRSAESGGGGGAGAAGGGCEYSTGVWDVVVDGGVRPGPPDLHSSVFSDLD